MLLTLTTTHRPATDLGFLLVKHPDRVHTFDLPYGTATVVFPEATPERCTAALLLEADPQQLAGRAALPAALSVLDGAAARGLEVAALRARMGSALESVNAYAAAYRPYVSQAPATLAPFALLAGENMSFADRDHGWQLAIADRLVAADPATFTATRRLVLDLADPLAVQQATEWWLELTSTGGEGMVVKPFGGLLVRNGKSLVQPGIKCRGREYLRIIYGPSYTEPDQLTALRNRHLGRKRGLALREHALGLTALETSAAGGAFHRVHELVFAILACESEPVDPRL